MLLNISDQILMENPSDADIENAVASVIVPPKGGPHFLAEEESFALLLKTDRKGDFVSVEKIERSSRLPEYMLRFRDAATGRAYRAWLPRAEIVAAVMQAFRAGHSPLAVCFEHGFIWCDHTEWSGELAQRAPGIDEEAEEELEERACITIGDVVETMFDVREHSPELAAILEAGIDEEPNDDEFMEPLPSRAESLAWMRVAIGEDALGKLHRKYSHLSPQSETRSLRLARKEWAEAMRSLARLARDREQWNSSAELEMKWVELGLAFQGALPRISELGLCPPPAPLLEVTA